jgi:hypothetical protein
LPQADENFQIFPKTLPQKTVITQTLELCEGQEKFPIFVDFMGSPHPSYLHTEKKIF